MWNKGGETRHSTAGARRASRAGHAAARRPALTTRRLLTVVLGIIGVAIVLGLLSLNAEMHAATWTAAETVATDGGASPVDSGAFVVAEIVRDGDEMLLFPQTGDVIRCNDGAIETADAPYLFKDGKLYTWVNGHRHRVWLFGVVAQTRPSIRVDG